MKPLYTSAEAMHRGRRMVDATHVHEDGGILLVEPQNGDILGFVEAPDSVERTRVSVRLSGPELDRAVARAMERKPGVGIGYFHVHIGGPATLSSGDYAQLDALQGDPRLPAFGIVKLLAVKRLGERTLFRVWIARAKGSVEEMELREVEDPIAARATDSAFSVLPRVRAHVLASDLATRRFTGEVEALEKNGYEVSADTSARGVVLRLGHERRKGTLVLTIPSEGWERPPKIEIADGNGASGSVSGTLALHAFLSGWSSAFTLTELVSFLEDRKLWPASGIARRIAKTVGAS